MSRRFWLFSVIFVATFVAYMAYSLRSGRDSVDDDDSAAATRPIAEKSGESVVGPVVASVAQHVSERKDATGVRKTVRLVQTRPARLDEQDPDGKNLDEKGFGIELVDLGALGVEDRIAFYVPQEDVEYEGQVTGLNTTASGNKVIVGSLFKEDRPFRFVFTVGARQTFGTLHTPQGRYQLETRDGIGRIVSARTLKEGLDYSEPDYLIPDRVNPELKRDEAQELARPG